MVKILSIALVIAMLGLLVQVYSTSKSQDEVKVYKAKCDSLQHVADSFYYELVPIQTELNRYSVAYSIFLKRNPEAAKQYGDIISDETE